MDPILVEHAAQTEANIFEEEAGDQSLLFPSLDDADIEDDEEDDAERVPKYYGSLISWTKGDQLGAVGVLYVILAIVSVNGRIMLDSERKKKILISSYCHSCIADLRRYLKSLHLPSNHYLHLIQYTVSSTTRSQKRLFYGGKKTWG